MIILLIDIFFFILQQIFPIFSPKYLLFLKNFANMVGVILRASANRFGVPAQNSSM